MSFLRERGIFVCLYKQAGAEVGLGKWAKSQALMLYSEEHDTPWVHKGFADAYNSVRGRVLQLIKVR